MPPSILIIPGKFCAFRPLTPGRDILKWVVWAAPGVACPRCTGGRRDAPLEDCGGIWVFNEQFAELGDLFNVGHVEGERLAGLATVLIPAR
jgi:hypothetical protein